MPSFSDLKTPSFKHIHIRPFENIDMEKSESGELRKIGMPMRRDANGSWIRLPEMWKEVEFTVLAPTIKRMQKLSAVDQKNIIFDKDGNRKVPVSTEELPYYIAHELIVDTNIDKNGEPVPYNVEMRKWLEHEFNTWVDLLNAFRTTYLEAGGKREEQKKEEVREEEDFLGDSPNSQETGSDI